MSAPIASPRKPFDGARSRYLALTLLAYAVWFACFELVGTVAARLPSHDLCTEWDRRIPLVPAAVWPYEACYLLPFLVPLVVRDSERLGVALLAAIIANLGAFFVYLAFPVAFARPRLGNSLSERMLALEYAWDFQPGANNLPSLHVAMSWLILITCHRQGLSRSAFLALALLTVAITVSTLLVKQHLLYDAVLGVAWAFAAFALAERVHHFHKQ
jgi:hypothetical protein